MEEKATHSHVESRNLKTFVVAVVVAVGGALVAAKVAGGLARFVW